MGVKMNIEQLSDLKKGMPRGWYQKVADKVKCSTQSVRNVFEGTCKDIDLIDKIISASIKLKKKHENREASIAQKVKSANK